MDWSCFQRVVELRNAGRIEDAICEYDLLLSQATSDDEKGSIVTGALVCHLMVDQLQQARRALSQIQQLQISDIEIRLNAEFCEPCLLGLEGRLGESAAAFAAILDRHGGALKEGRFRYLYEDIQSRRAWTLFSLSRLTEALPVLKEAASFSIEDPTDAQRIHFALGACYSEINDEEAAKQEFFGAVGLNLKNDLEERARYRLARLLVKSGGFAQARVQLEAIVQEYRNRAPEVPQAYVYELLSQVHSNLGDAAAAKRFSELAAAAGARGSVQEPIAWPTLFRMPDNGRRDDG
jgi:tetratricopeptide (TPR) repeat protein